MCVSYAPCSLPGHIKRLLGPHMSVVTVEMNQAECLSTGSILWIHSLVWGKG
jgi:hypothetical protein